MKDFQEWHILKNQLDIKEQSHLFNEKDIWWCSLGENIWYEQDGKNEQFERPVVILKKYNAEIFFWAPLTTSTKDHPLRYPYKINDTEWSINLTQCRTWSAKRLLRRMGRISDTEMNHIYDLLSNDWMHKKAKAPNKSEQSRAPDGEK